MLKESLDTSLVELGAALSRIDEAQVRAAVEAIAAARRIVCAGAGRVGLGLKFFVMRLGHLGLDAHWAWDDTAPALGEGDLFILANGSGRENHAHHAARRAREAGANVLLFTASPQSPSAHLAEVLVRIPAPAFNAADADLTPSTQAMGTLYEHAAVILYDAMVPLLMERLSVSAAQMRGRHRNYE